MMSEHVMEQCNSELLLKKKDWQTAWYILA